MREPIIWLGPRLAMTSVVAADVWKTTPFVAIILLAGLKSIPRDYYEAAELDGAGWWRTFVGITLPLLKPFIAIAVLFRAMDAFRIFDLIWVLTGGASGTGDALHRHLQNALPLLRTRVRLGDDGRALRASSSR